MRQLEQFDPTKIKHHEAQEKLVNVLMQECENQDPNFFRVLVSYFFAKIASTMRAELKLYNGRTLPVNVYAINLAPSGAGKGKSKGFMEREVTHLFFDRFKEETLPDVARVHMAKLAHRKAVRNASDPDEELKLLEAEFKASGEWLSEFDSATPAALKQFRHKLKLASAGALNFEIDEIGDNLTGNADAFSKVLELYDRGEIKESLVKNTKENQRLSEVKGITPTNVLMFGTPSSLLDGSKTEDEFYSMQEKGYARRCLFGFSREVQRNRALTAEQILEARSDPDAYEWVEDFAEHLMNLADASNFNRKILIERDEELLCVEYQIWCQDRADELGEFDVIRKTEIEHRHFKTRKLAAAYAFIDGSPTVTADHIYAAIAVVEESGKQLNKLLTRDRPYVKLAKYLGEMKRPLTHADLDMDLPFYKGSAAAKTDMLTMAIAWGYANHVIIKKSYQEGIEFLRGETLEETNTDELTVSYSDHVAHNYLNESITWEQLAQLTQADGYHWVAHHVLEGHRCEEKAIPGFNLIVIDVDGGTPLAVAQDLLKDYKAMFYTTKRHGENGEERFRMILPMKYTLKLDSTDYKEFMQAIYDWLPFEVDAQTGQRARKWLSNNGDLHVQDGVMFDPIAFIPRTTKNEERKEKLLNQQSLTNLERWFVNHTGIGNRSNNVVRYALLLVDGGKSLTEVEEAVRSLNTRIQDPLPDDEIQNTIMVTAAKAYARTAQAA